MATITTSSPAYGVQPITVTWTLLTGADTKIALAKQGAGADDVVDWVYTNGTQVVPMAVVASGSHTFDAIRTPGFYVARVLKP